VVAPAVRAGAAPGRRPVLRGAACVHHALVSEGKDALAAGGGAGCQAEALTGAGGVAVAPTVSDDVVG